MTRDKQVAWMKKSAQENLKNKQMLRKTWILELLQVISAVVMVTAPEEDSDRSESNEPNDGDVG